MKKFYAHLITLSILFSATVAYAQPTIGLNTFFTNTTSVLQLNTACVVTKTTVVTGWLFSIASTSNCGFNWTNASGGDGRVQYQVGFGTLTQATFGSDDGSQFALTSLVWGVSTSSWTSKPMALVGYKNGLPVPGATLNATTPAGTGITNTLTVTFSTNTSFNDVDEVRLAPVSATCNAILFIETITIGTSTSTCITPTLSLSSSTNVLCKGGNTGSASISASGGSGFTYTWNPGGGNLASATGLSAGIYTCIATNSCGSSNTATIAITEPASALSASTAVINAVCNGSNGSANVTANGGTSPYTYTWSSGPTTSVVPTLLAGTYSVKVTDAHGCTSVKSVSINAPAPLTITAVASSESICAGASVTLTASGANTYSWSTSQSGNAIVVSPSITSSYTVIGTSTNNCSNSTVIAQAVDPCLGINNVFALNGIRIYPNPNSGEFSITLNELQTGLTLEVYDFIGQLVLSTELKDTRTNVNLGQKAKGIYSLRLFEKGSLLGQKKISVQ